MATIDSLKEILNENLDIEPERLLKAQRLTNSVSILWIWQN